MYPRRFGSRRRPSGHPLGFAVVSQISRDEVAHLARLARLALTESVEYFAGQLDAILTHVSQIQVIDVTGVQANGTIRSRTSTSPRPDETAPCLTQRQVPDQAPDAAATSRVILGSERDGQ